MGDKTHDVHPVDIHVGLRLRTRRRFLKMSLETLAGKLGLAFQQVQKYEHGANRVTASRLYDLSLALQVPVTYFFDGFDDSVESGGFLNTESEQAVSAFIRTREGLELAEAFPRIPVGPRRHKLLDLVRTLAEDDD